VVQVWALTAGRRLRATKWAKSPDLLSNRCKQMARDKGIVQHARADEVKVIWPREGR
jgi:hypothetical protein